MTMGRVIQVTTLLTGASTVGVEAVGQTVISMDNINSFALDAGLVYIGTTVWPYTSIDRTNSTLTLSSPLTEALPAGTPVLTFPFSVRRWAFIQPDSFDGVPSDAVWALIPHTLAAFVADDGLRDDADQEKVKFEAEGSGLMVTDVLDKKAWLNPTTIPEGAITETNIQPGSITSPLIGANAVLTQHLEAGAVKAEQLDAEVLRAGFTLTGRLQVGTGYWTPMDGIVIPQPDGSTTRFPTDGVTSATISGHVKAKSLTVEKDLVLLGTTNQIQGVLKLGNGVTRPVAPPVVYQSWDSRYADALDNAGAGWQIYRGAAPAASTSEFIAAVNFGGAGLRRIDKTTGAWLGDPTVGKSWTSGFVPTSGVAFANSHYFIYGQDTNRSNGWYLYKINASFDKVAELYIGGAAIHNSLSMRITASSATGGVYLLWCNNASQVRMFTWDTNLGFLSDSLVYTATAAKNIIGAYVGPGDYGSNKLLVGVAEDRMVYGWALTGLARDTSIDFPMPFNAAVMGITYDATLGKFIMYDEVGRVVHGSLFKNPRAITATYTWYDGNATNGTHETEPSPNQPFTLPARSLLNLEMPPPPDSGVTDPSRTDKANMIGVYLGIDGAARRRQTYLGVDGSGVSIRNLLGITTITNNLNLEPASNGFSTATAAPGTLVSGATNGLGAPELEFTGAGNGRVKDFEITGTFTKPARSGVDYTPVMYVGSGSLFSASAIGRYYLIDGKWCEVTWTVQITDAGTAGGASFSMSLPFPCRTGSSYMFMGRENQTSGNQMQILVSSGTDRGACFYYNNTNVTASSRQFIISGGYEIP